MATRADMMLMQALTQLGAGFGAHMGRRRQTKQYEEAANQMYPMTTPEQMMDPQDTQLIQALSGAMPGVAGMVSGAGMQGNQMMRASGQAEQANAHAQKMREMMKNPQFANLMMQGTAQAELAKMTPKERKISDRVMSVADGVMIMDPDTGKLEFQKTKGEAKKTQVVKPGDRIYDPETGQVVYTAPPNSKMKSWLSEESQMGENGIPESRGLIVFEDGTKIPFSDFGPSSKSFGITSPVMSSGEKSKWRGKIEDTRQSLREFGEIKRMFDPDFLTTMGRARSGASEIMSRFGVIDLFPGEKERYTDKAEFFASVSDRANRYIKEITGAQMSEAEAKRLLTAIPNVKDDPVSFSAKLSHVMRVSEAALNQYEEVLWQTQSQDAAKAAADMVVREMMSMENTEIEFGESDEPSFVGD